MIIFIYMLLIILYIIILENLVGILNEMQDKMTTWAQKCVCVDYVKKSKSEVKYFTALF